MSNPYLPYHIFFPISFSFSLFLFPPPSPYQKLPCGSLSPSPSVLFFILPEFSLFLLHGSTSFMVLRSPKACTHQPMTFMPPLKTSRSLRRQRQCGGSSLATASRNNSEHFTGNPDLISRQYEYCWNPHSKLFPAVPIFPDESSRKIGTLFRPIETLQVDPSQARLYFELMIPNSYS